MLYSLKVLFFISSFPKLSETFILNQITGFIDRGIEVEILAWNKVENKENHAAIAEYNLLDKTRFLNFPSSRWKRLVGGIGLFLTSVFTSPKTTFSAFNYKKYGKMIFTFRFLYALPYFLEREAGDAVICHYGPNGSIASFLKDQGLLPEQTMVFFHGHDLTSFTKRQGIAVYDSLFASDITLLPVSQLFSSKLIKMGADASNIKVHHMGINLAEFSLISPVPMESTMKFLSIGRLTEKKGMDVTIEVMEALKASGVDVSLEIIGEGELRQQLESQIKQANLSNEVTLLGWQSQVEINKAIEKADIMMQLSKTAANGDKEGIPVVLMEAMGRGKLIISTEHSGIPELITNNKNGWLVPEGAVQETIQKVLEIRDNPEQWLPVSLQAREKIDAEFNIDRLNDQLALRCMKK